MHPGDAVLWRMTHPDKSFRAVSDGDAVRVGGTELRALHTRGTPWIGVLVCARAGSRNRHRVQRRHAVRWRAGCNRPLVFRLPTILRSISGRLGALPGDTVVHTGHGDSTTIGDEIVHYEEWVARGH